MVQLFYCRIFQYYVSGSQMMPSSGRWKPDERVLCDPKTLHYDLSKYAKRKWLDPGVLVMIVPFLKFKGCLPHSGYSSTNLPLKLIVIEFVWDLWAAMHKQDTLRWCAPQTALLSTKVQSGAVQQIVMSYSTSKLTKCHFDISISWHVKKYINSVMCPITTRHTILFNEAVQCGSDGNKP